MRTVLCVFMACSSFLVASMGSVQPSPPYSFSAFTDLVYYDGPNAHPVKHRLDLFVPDQVPDAPVLIFVHGGAWTSGDKNLYSFVGQAFARQGFATAVINYRLSPAVQHPAHIEDVARALSWVYKNIAQYKGNPEKIFITGHSAGGHLTALVALDEKYLQAQGLTLSAVKGALPISGIYDLSIAPPGMSYNAIFGSDPAVRRDASPITHAGPNKPPFLVIYAQFDFPGLGAQGQQLVERLKQNDNDAALLSIPNKDHVSIIFSLGAPNDLTTEAMLSFMRRIVGN